jgi:hypothetical protein
MFVQKFLPIAVPRSSTQVMIGSTGFSEASSHTYLKAQRHIPDEVISSNSVNSFVKFM